MPEVGSTIVLSDYPIEWGRTKETITHGGETYYHFECYFLRRSALRDAHLLEEQGYDNVVAYTGILTGWDLYSTYGLPKHPKKTRSQEV